jgi:hypothetical protein
LKRVHDGEPKTSVEHPTSRGPVLGVSHEYEKEAFGRGDFAEPVLEGVRARGQAIKIVEQHEQAGYWMGIQIDPESHELAGGATGKLNALVEGY